MKSHYDVVVLGGGAAGLMCALTAAQRGRRVLVLERANKLGKKILMSGGGRCNFTNLHVEPSRFLGGNPHFCKSALSRYTQWDFIALVEKHGIPYHEKETVHGLSGQLFCDISAKQIVAMLVAECEAGGVDILTRCETETLRCKGEHYRIRSSQGHFDADAVVVATGGLSIPSLGGSPYGYTLAEQFGLELLPRRAGLVPFTLTDQNQVLSETLSGISHDVHVHCETHAFREHMLFTHRGLSGPAMLQISSYWAPGDELHINLLPDLVTTHGSVADWLCDEKAGQGSRRLRQLLSEHFPRKFLLELEARHWPQEADRPLAEWPDGRLRALGAQLEDWCIRPAGTEGYRTAEVTLGGVDTRQVSSKTMECVNQPGLYFVGEVLDVTGHLGGFNFQWAWSSGWAAGMSV